MTSWVAYTEDYGDFPYKTYDACIFLEKTLEMLQEGAVEDYEENTEKLNIIHNIMRMSYMANEKDTKCEISDVIDMVEEIRKRHSYFLECAAEPGVTNLVDGIKAYKE
jgi:hypothetical protein